MCILYDWFVTPNTVNYTISCTRTIWSPNGYPNSTRSYHMCAFLYYFLVCFLFPYRVSFSRSGIIVRNDLHHSWHDMQYSSYTTVFIIDILISLFVILYIYHFSSVQFPGWLGVQDLLLNSIEKLGLELWT